MDMLVTCMVLLEIIISMPWAVSFSAGLTCDRTKQNPVRNDTSMAIVRCLNCRDCLPGYEPVVPCGKVIGIYDPVGRCRPCPDGMYSPNRDTKACKICQKKKCFKHQRIEGKCERDKHDQSKCLNECENGYGMNKRKTACRLMNMTTTTTNDGSNIPKATPTMTSINTTKKLVVSQNQANEKSSGLNPGVIAVIVIAAVAVVGIPIAVYCYCCRNRKRANIIGKKDGDGSASTDVLMDRPSEKNGHSFPVSPLVEIPDQETVEQANGLVSHVPPCQKPMAEFDNSMFLPPIVSIRYPSSSHVSSNSNQNHQDRLEGDIPYKIILRIRSHFDVGERWQDLADWLDLLSREVNHIKANQLESKTEQIIEIWTTKQENDLRKFLQILNDKGMTQLVVEIKEMQAACRQ